MLPAEVVVREVQGECRVVVLPFLAVGVRQPRHPPDGHAETQVLAFDVTGASPIQVRRADARGRVAIYHLSRRVPNPARFARRCGVDFDELREVHVVAESRPYGREVRPVAVR